MIYLSILICSVHTRYDTFLPKIERQLFEQYAALSASDQKRVEILVLMDNKKMMLGRKRNIMVAMAQGEYTVFVDDDDRVSSDYIQTLLDATDSGVDCISFRAEVVVNNEPPKICYFSKDFGSDSNNADSYYRIPNHICCVKRSVSIKSEYLNISYQEDTWYALELLKHLDTELVIDRVLYYYDFDANTSEVQDQQ